MRTFCKKNLGEMGKYAKKGHDRNQPRICVVQGAHQRFLATETERQIVQGSQGSDDSVFVLRIIPAFLAKIAAISLDLSLVMSPHCCLCPPFLIFLRRHPYEFGNDSAQNKTAQKRAIDIRNVCCGVRHILLLIFRDFCGIKCLLNRSWKIVP